MSKISLEMSDPTVKRLVNTAFPGYNGRMVWAEITDKIHFHSTNWDSGYHREYRIIRLADNQVVQLPDAPFLQPSKLHEESQPIPEGFIVVVHVNSGQRESVEIHARSEVVSPNLPAPIEVTDDERIVLIATRSLKSSYGGIKDFRFSEAQRSRGITRDRWDVAKASCIAKSLLNKAGAITPSGRNAVGMASL